jgi:hypothetical protein
MNVQTMDSAVRDTLGASCGLQRGWYSRCGGLQNLLLRYFNESIDLDGDESAMADDQAISDLEHKLSGSMEEMH